MYRSCLGIYVFQTFFLTLLSNYCKLSSLFCRRQCNVLMQRFKLLKEIAQFGSSRPEVFCEKGVLRNFAKLTIKRLCQSLFFNKVAGLGPATLLKKRLCYTCYPVNFAKFLRTPFLTEHLWWLLLVYLSKIICLFYICVLSVQHGVGKTKA